MPSKTRKSATDPLILRARRGDRGALEKILNFAARAALKDRGPLFRFRRGFSPGLRGLSLDDVVQAARIAAWAILRQRRVKTLRFVANAAVYAARNLTRPVMRSREYQYHRDYRHND